jgi:AcrR family transcriptional regulator
MERGFADASVEAISEAAGFTRGAFYSNFQSKDELFVELLERQVFEVYRRMARQQLERSEPDSLRATGKRLAAIVHEADGGWAFRLWLELLSHAARDEEFRALASRFWRATRDLTEQVVAGDHADEAASPVPPRAIATALIALDIGLALQHLVDPDDVPLSLYPELYEALFEPLRKPAS